MASICGQLENVEIWEDGEKYDSEKRVQHFRYDCYKRRVKIQNE